MGEAYGLSVAPNAPPPAPGTWQATRVKDDETGIRFELDRMVAAVRGAVHDGPFIAFVKDVVKAVAHLEGRPDYRLAQVAAWYEFTKMNFQYVNDPISYVCEGAT